MSLAKNDIAVDTAVKNVDWPTVFTELLLLHGTLISSLYLLQIGITIFRAIRMFPLNLSAKNYFTGFLNS